MPSTNEEFWKRKFEANKRKDELALISLQNLGWRTAVVWECAMGLMSVTTYLIEVENLFVRRKVATGGDEQSNRENW